ncbi:MAG: winged helix-turn-helix transcriptional regulator, partial [Anaerolineae bacterium]|nr:winged helix-turn-helix transcriptional regulator [Anaerolineae bacterium]
ESRRLESRRLESHDMERLRMLVYDDMEAHFLYCWHHLTEEEQEALALLPGEVPVPAVEQLKKWGLVVERGGQHQIFSPLFETFVRDRAGLLRLDLPQRQVYVAGRAIDLTPSQYAVLRLLAAHPGQLVSYEELAQEVWPGEYYEGPERTKVLVSKLRERLGPAGTCVQNRRGFGYVLELAGVCGE